jgi:RecB family exonuclease
MSFLLSLFAIIEHVNKSELTTTSKKLIIAYVNEASEKTATDKARAAVQRYTEIVLPTLDSIREKSRTQKLDALDHLVLKLEYEASRLKM